MRSWPWLPLVAWVLLWLSALQVDGSIHQYHNAVFTKKPKAGNAYVFYGGSEGLYKSNPRKGASGVDVNGKSYIRLTSQLKIRRTDIARSETEEYYHPVEAVIVEVADMQKIGDTFEVGQRSLCCSPDMSRERGCVVGSVIIYQQNKTSPESSWPRVIEIPFDPNTNEAHLLRDEDVEITRTGMYTLYFFACDSKLQGLAIEGMTVWKNPSGYLPGKMAPFMTFYGFMSLSYLILGIVWFLQYVRFWKDILQLQNCITAVIALGMCEMAMWYFEYVNFNTTGYRPIGITLWAVTLGAVKKTVSRLLILVVSMGYGVVRPTLGGLTSKVILLGGTYFLASESLDVVENVGAINDLSGKARLFLVLPVAILDAFFILWIFTSLSRTLEKLQARRMFAKLELYRKFTNSLAIAVVIAVAWIGYELYFKATDRYGERWQSTWIVSAFWNILTFVLLCIICALWTPSQNSTRYAFSEDVGEDFDEEEAVELAPSAKIAEAEKIPKQDKEKKTVNTDVFSLEDDPEDDKRE